MSLARLLRPRSIAIVGASDKIGPGFNAWKALAAVGYAGTTHLVNPNKPTLFGQRTYPSLADVPGAVDAVFIAVPYERVLETMRQAAAKGAGGAAILSSGFGEAGEEGARAQRELIALADANGMAVCGPNCLGFLNFAGRAALFGTSLPDHVPRGGVAAILQSGSIGIALLNAAREIGFSHLITSGNEAVTTAADYLEALVEDPDVRLVVVFLEQLRKPETFIRAARRARSLGKPVVVLKTGRSARGREAVMAHTGAVAGSDEVCDAAFRAASVIRVASLDELIETAVLASNLSRRPKADGVAMLSLSGGEIALALDNGEAAALKLLPVVQAKDAITALMPPFAHIANPLDLTWAGLYDATVAERCAKVLGAQADVGMLVLLQDAPQGLGEQQATRYSTLLGAVARGAEAAGVPLVAVSNIAGALHPAYGAVAKETGVPCLRGTQEGLFAVARYLRWATATEPPAVALSPKEKDEARRRLDAVSPARLPTESEARRVLAAYGVPGLSERLVQTAEEAAAAAQAHGFPVVLKAMVENVVHKSDAGLVKVGLGSAAAVREAAAAMLDRAKAMDKGHMLGFLVQEQVSSVAELLVGARVDPEFGPVVVVGGGGLLVELYKDVALRLAPVDEATALAMIQETTAGALLTGWRGRAVADTQAAARVVAALSRFIVDFRDSVPEVEINPLAVMAVGQGCRALDAVIVRSPMPS
jgi:acyl-CoA synthetase (NDP forming)